MSKYIIAVLIIFLSYSETEAHEVRPGRLKIDQVSDSTWQIYWKLPAIKEGVLKLQPLFEATHEVISREPDRDLGDAYVTQWTIWPKTDFRGTQVIIDGLERTITDVFVTVSHLNGDESSFLVRPNKPYFFVDEVLTSWQIAKNYIILGIEHILFGYDHLLFVLCLVWLVNGLKKLVQTITAFTLAHSITLAASVLGWIIVPSAPVEAVIALSIVFLAFEIIQHQKGQKVFTSQYPWVVALSFGLLHGFGFAGALNEVGLPGSAIPLSLFGFNVGVEIGQLIFILFIVLVARVFKKLIKTIPKQIPRMAIYAIGSLASFWLVERVVGFWY